jgi:hypothetical protein
MSETIRQRLKKRGRMMLLVTLAGLLIFGSSAFVGLDSPQPALVAVGWLLAIGGLVAIRWIKCPQCRATIGTPIAMPLVFPQFLGAKPNYCLYCGVSLDEPVPQPEAKRSPPQGPIQ